MKAEPKIKAASVVLILICLIGTFIYVKQFKTKSTTNTNNELLLSNNILASADDIVETNNSETNEENVETSEESTETNDENNSNQVTEEIVYDGLTRQELIDKLNRNLNSTLSGTGEIFADKALNLGIDPYLAVAIVLHETGCSWDCSDLVKYCYNVGGQKGSPGCGNGSYMAFSSLDEGIDSFMNNLYNNYYAYGLTTPETINPKYAASTTWASSINNYINKIKAS